MGARSRSKLITVFAIVAITVIISLQPVFGIPLVKTKALSFNHDRQTNLLGAYRMVKIGLTDCRRRNPSGALQELLA